MHMISLGFSYIRFLHGAFLNRTQDFGICIVAKRAGSVLYLLSGISGWWGSEGGPMWAHFEFYSIFLYPNIPRHCGRHPAGSVSHLYSSFVILHSSIPYLFLLLLAFNLLRGYFLSFMRSICVIYHVHYLRWSLVAAG